MQAKLIFSSLFFASSALAAPSDPLAVRDTQGIGSVSQQSKPLTLAPKNIAGNGNYTSNWAGAMYHPLDRGIIWNSALTNMTVPKVSVAPGATGDFHALAWVGIDGGILCPSAMLQVGVHMTAVGSKGKTTKQTYRAWYQWYPDNRKYIDNFDINAGDVLQMSVQASKPNIGAVFLKNGRTGRSVNQKLTSKASLCGKNVEYMVDDFASTPHHDGLADFGEVVFNSCLGGSLHPEMLTGQMWGAQSFNVKKEADKGPANAYTTVNITGVMSVKVKYDRR
ncbi:MAG: hypothetical protein Q9160_002986 [Pyrenula sp. 1 TL-2023]